MANYSVNFNNIIIKLEFDSTTDFELQLIANHDVDAYIDWNNMLSSPPHINWSGTTNSAITHEYDAGVYYLGIRGKFEALSFFNNSNIIEVVSFGDSSRTNLKYLSFESSTLEILPNKLILKNQLSNVLNFDNVFKNCMSLVNIPPYLFEGLNITSFNSTFESSHITKIPMEIFLSQKGSIVDFRKTFKNCSFLSECAPDLWNKYFINGVHPDPDECFLGCVSLSNYPGNISNNCGNTIPISWT